MAGIRQHILPRFLLKGFASRFKGEEVFTWVYRKGTQPFETNIVNVSVEKHFYGKEGEISADDEITNLEGEYAKFIDEIREQEDQTEISDPRVASFIAHLSVRTKHLRDSFRESTEYLVDEAFEFLSDFGNFKRLILNDPNLIKEQLEKALANVTAPQWQKDLVRLRAPQMLPAFLDDQKIDLQETFQIYMAIIREVMPKAIREGHIKSLAKKPIPETRAADYRKMRWFVRKPEQPMILGDFGCIFETGGARRFTSLDDKDDTLVNAFLPLSSDRVLIGTSYSTMPHVNPKVINKAIARCSREFFVCSESSLNNSSLQKSIGDWSSLVSKEELERLVKEILHDYQS